MSILKYTEETKNNVISVIKDPFFEKNIIGIRINYVGDAWGNPYWYVKVEFKNGNTKGEQMSDHCESMEETLFKLKQILDSLKNK